MSDQVSAEQFRQLFPSLTDRTYLASCSQGAASDGLLNALTTFQESLFASRNPWDIWAPQVEVARAAFASLINGEPHEIAVLSCASEGAFQAASTLAWASRPTIVSSMLEFPSVANVWRAQEQRGAKVEFVDVDEDGFVSADGFADLIDGDTGLVSVALNTYRHGQRLPVEEVARLAHDAGALVFVDAYQGIGVQDVDVKALDCDFLVAGALKYMLGLPGIAFLYVKSGVGELSTPALTGWFGQANPMLFEPRDLTYAGDARKFQTGSPPIPSVYAAIAGMELITKVPMAVAHKHIDELTSTLHNELVAMGEQVVSPADHRRGSQVTFRDPNPVATGEALNLRGVVTSPRGDLIRTSFHYYSDLNDVEQLVRALRRVRSTQ